MGHGAPTKYKEEYANIAKKFCLLKKDATDVDLAELFDVAEATIYNWKEQFPSFLEAIKEGKEQADVEVAHSLYKKAIGDIELKKFKFATDGGKITDIKEYKEKLSPDVTAMIFWLKNRHPEIWRDKKNIEVSGEKLEDFMEETENEND